MANPVICERYIANSNIEDHSQKVLTSTEHLLLCGSYGENRHGTKAVLYGVQFCMNEAFQCLY